MPPTAYESLTNSVLAWKKTHKVGRFDPNAPAAEREKITASFQEVEARGIDLEKRVRLLPQSDHRRGRVAFVGEVEEIPGVGAWVGVVLDEPTGKNDGSVKGVRLFECRANCGVFVRAERLEVGEFLPLELDDELMDDEDDEF